MKYEGLKKKTKKAFGKKIWLLGKDKQGTSYWLEEPSWDYSRYWYWGFGYVKTYTNQSDPSKAKDIASHSHFDGLFLDEGDPIQSFEDFFESMTLSEDEVWKLSDLMSSAYTLKKSAAVFERGHSNLSAKAVVGGLKDEGLAKEINERKLPTVFREIERLLEG